MTDRTKPVDYLEKARVYANTEEYDSDFAARHQWEAQTATAFATIALVERLDALIAAVGAQKQPAQMGRCPECRWYSTPDLGCDHKLVQWEPTLFAGDMPNFGCVYFERKA